MGITNKDDMIYFNDMLERIQELENELNVLWVKEKETNPNIPFDVFLETLYTTVYNPGVPMAKEHHSLKKIEKQCREISEYSLDDDLTLINENYFKRYIDENIEDAWGLQVDLDLPDWISIVVDYDLNKKNYSKIYFDDQIYYL